MKETPLNCAFRSESQHERQCACAVGNGEKSWLIFLEFG